MNRPMEEVKAKTDTTINIGSLDDLKELVNSIPEGTIYSVNLSEVIRIGQNNGES